MRLGWAAFVIVVLALPNTEALQHSEKNIRGKAIEKKSEDFDQRSLLSQLRHMRKQNNDNGDTDTKKGTPKKKRILHQKKKAAPKKKDAPKKKKNAPKKNFYAPKKKKNAPKKKAAPKK